MYYALICPPPPPPPSACPAESVLAPLLLPDADQLPDWTLLVLYLAEQCYYLDRGLPLPKPAWGPYLQSLPKPPMGTVLDWPLDEVRLTLHCMHQLTPACAAL
jgi:hypothetical protein